MSQLDHPFWTLCSPLSSVAIIVFELVGVARDLHPITVRIEKADRAITRDDQSFRTADNRNISTLQNWIDLFDDIIRFHIDAEIMHFRRSVAVDVLHSLRQRLQRDVMVFFAVAHESHLGIEISRRDFQPENRAIKLFRLFEIRDIQHDVSKYAVANFHRRT